MSTQIVRGRILFPPFCNTVQRAASCQLVGLDSIRPFLVDISWILDDSGWKSSSHRSQYLVILCSKCVPRMFEYHRREKCGEKMRLYRHNWVTRLSSVSCGLRAHHHSQLDPPQSPTLLMLPAIMDGKYRHVPYFIYFSKVKQFRMILIDSLNKSKEQK